MAMPSYTSSDAQIFSHSMGRFALAMFSRSCSLVMGVASRSDPSSSVDVRDSGDTVR